MSMEKDTLFPGNSKSSSFSFLNSSSCPDDKSKSSAVDAAFAAFKECEDRTFELAISKLILECVRNVAVNEDRKLLQSTAEKLRNILHNYDVSKYIRLPFGMDNEPTRMLGIMSLPDAVLNREEQLEINNRVESLLQSKIKEILLVYEEENYNVEECVKAAEGGTRERFFKKFGLTETSHMQSKIEEAIQKYEEDLLSCYEQFVGWKERKSALKNSTVDKIEDMNKQVHITELKARMSYMNCFKQMFNEMPYTVDAFRTVNEMLDKKLDWTDNEIHEKKDLLEQYKSLEGTEFDDILKQYKEVCSVIEKKKKILDEL